MLSTATSICREMNKPVLDLIRLNDDVFSCVLKIPYCQRDMYKNAFDLQISVSKDKTIHTLHREIVCDKIIIPEVYLYLPDSECCEKQYTDMGRIKFKINGDVSGSRISVTCRYNDVEMASLEREVDALTVSTYSRCEPGFSIKTDSRMLLANSYDIISEMHSELPKTTGLVWNGTVNDIIVNDVERLYDFVGGFSTLEGFCTSYLNNVICCVFHEKNLKNILIHETVHALLYNIQGFVQNRINRAVGLLVEGYCQHVMNDYTERKSVEKRGKLAMHYLQHYMDDIVLYFLDSEEQENKYTDILFSYELLPMLFSKWDDQGTLLKGILSLPESFAKICDDIQSMINIMVSENIDYDYVNEANELYGKAYEILFDSTDDTFLGNLAIFRRRIEDLYFGDY